jgi:hypothetical protein
MPTLTIRYAFNPDKLHTFKASIDAEQEPITRSGRKTNLTRLEASGAHVEMNR